MSSSNTAYTKEIEMQTWSSMEAFELLGTSVISATGRLWNRQRCWQQRGEVVSGQH